MGPDGYDESFEAEKEALAAALGRLQVAAKGYDRGRGLGPAGLKPLRGQS
jgi:hypothetical protein